VHNAYAEPSAKLFDVRIGIAELIGYAVVPTMQTSRGATRIDGMFG